MSCRRVRETAVAPRKMQGAVVGRGIAALLAVAAALVLLCGSAEAKLMHPYLSSFGSFSDVQGVAVESESGTVYVYDGGAGTVYKFDASGNPVNFTATGTNALGGVGFVSNDEGEIAVDSSSGPAKGDIYLAHADGSIEIYSAAGSKLGELTESTAPWGEACGVAVDPSGRVYVGLYGSNVNVYVPSANPVTNGDYATSLNGLSGVCNVAADSAANVFADSWSSGPVMRYDSSQLGASTAKGSVVDEAGSTIAVDPSNDELYVDERSQIAQFGPHGNPPQAPLSTFASSGLGAIGGSFGIAVSGFNHDIYASDGEGQVSVFGPTELSLAPPAIEEQYATGVAGTSATLNGKLNPEGRATTYRFEYGLTASYGSSTAEMNGGSGLASELVQAHVQELGAATVYHYRLVAVNSVGTTYGADQILTTQPVGGELHLLDGRQWELVSPPNKRGAVITPISEAGVIEAAPDGGAITYPTDGPTELEPQGNVLSVQSLARRGTQGWSSTNVSPPHDRPTGVGAGEGGEYRFFSPDLSLAIVEPWGPFRALSPEATERTPYIRHDFTCEADPQTCYLPLVTAANVPSGTKFGGVEGLFGEAHFVGATPDLSYVVISSFQVGLTSTPGDEGGLYEWHAGQLQMVSILPEGEGGAPTDAFLGYHEGGNRARNAVSEDGSRVFWSAYPGSGLYMRDMVKQETIRIGSERADFQIASGDGSHVFFSTGEQGALEECDVVKVAGKLTCEITRLADNVQAAVLGASEDGSYVYFVSDSVLAPGAVPGECEGYQVIFSPASVTCNLYVAHRNGSTWESPKLIAVLSAKDGADWAGPSDTNMAGLTARVSPDGHWLAFMSQRNLTGYDNHDAVSGKPDEEVYLYNTNADRLACASCDPTGARPAGAEYASMAPGLVTGDRVWEPETWLAANIPGWTPYALGAALYQSRYLSGEGRLFFNSSDALVPQDVNGTWDVYEFEPAGVGSCAPASAEFEAASGGCVDLISAGSSPEESAFLDASESGDDVFFLTQSHLQSSDFDTADDIYDAHVCSATVSCYSPPVSPPPCDTSDSCKVAPSPQPSVFGAPPSATFAGIGNVTGSSGESARPRSLTRAQKLRRALRACHRRRSRRKRSACARRVRKQYGVKKAKRGSR